MKFASACAALGLALPLSFAVPAVLPASAAPAGLSLTTGSVITDPTGAFISVQVANTGTLMLSQIVVTCDFFSKSKKKLGTSSTTLFSTFPGITGADQVRLMGATSAVSATCAITSPN
ncbi:MAG: hypothetical protein B7Y12_15840 [Rhizobiales bacterium 24-66-13]|jgi:hypothetical protein|uniref:hypothetical protein n=1 Tax=Roseixanthobacter finlandensis TaxID=3119922 RepID=UPI000BD3EC51|nr:MAG: hypothetical protein B7Y61_07095 [Rhizobiales bacterium 35-66-30]OYZ72164.1 MAG: hypothetical protein B7Y12_15840 [Rhizobiales bacterium 24-66-13]OZB07164.1 MAG: hypothetical protein B7X67_09165 [Rhizobiales bacterium 39-66-18]HQS07277.1 hypothetical protein [Xanthobacteraceae bacterium]HQS47708.1 hypothetical protein [Xanthobacteraceae bacterium]